MALYVYQILFGELGSTIINDRECFVDFENGLYKIASLRKGRRFCVRCMISEMGEEILSLKKWFDDLEYCKQEKFAQV